MRKARKKINKNKYKKKEPIDYGLIGQDYYDGIPEWIEKLSINELHEIIEEGKRLYPPLTDEERKSFNI
ncbi:MAG: hypothetical protein LUG12_00460 [Erysipelotrichaceae bacterium]|nr:hypothetical protein [Erysipelotrichaceae bacterium]